MQGFSIIELLVVILIISLISIVCLTGLQKLYATHLRHEYLNSLADLLDAAKVEALTANANFIICPSRDHATCSGNWNDGVMLQSATGGVIAEIMPPATGDTLAFKGFHDNERITFYGNQLLNNNGTFTYQSQGGASSVLKLRKTGDTRIVDLEA